ILGGELSRRTDVYALGALLYEMIAGIPPFKKPSTAALARAVLEEAPRPPATIWSGLPDTLGTVALRALEKDPEARYPSAAAFAVDIERALRGETIGGVPIRRVRPHRSALSRLAGAVADAIVRRQRFLRGLLLGLVVGTALGYAAARAGLVGRSHAALKRSR
ncbi:hypothetical protein HY251_02330, partial [bacterium]|nr:hypothetical protein [bacterium]